MSKQIDFNIEIDSFLNSINDKFEYKYGGLKVTAKKKFYQDPQSIDITEITFCVLTQMQTSIRSLSVETKINGVSELYYLDRYYQWKSLSAKCIVSVTTPIVVRYNYHSGKTFELRSLRGYHSYSIKRNGNRVSITYFIDHAALHPKWNFINDVMVSDAVTELPVGFEYQIDFLLFETDSLIEEFPVTPGRFPSAMEACFCITDHCDFDSTEKLELFLNGDSNDNGWLGKGLRMTKGAFSLASKPWHRPEVVSLEDKEYSIAIKKLYEDGSEIAPHGLQDSASLEINPNLFSSTLSRFSAEWHPGTWIDHGKYFEYSYLKGGDKNDYMLLEELEKSGIKLLWSYHDISSDASSGLNLIAPKSNDAITITKIILYHLFALRIPIALHFFRSFLRKRCSKSRVAFVVLQIISMIKTLLYTKNPKVHSWNYIRAQIKRLVESLRSDSFNRMSYYSRREELELAPAIYPERGVPINHVKENEHLRFARMRYCTLVMFIAKNR